MTKFKRLSIEELKELEKEFVEFLIINGIVADDWEDLKSKSPEKAEEIINQFSDVVYTAIFRKNQFLDFLSKDEIKCFQFLNDKVVLVGVKTLDDSIDFRTASLTELKDRKFEVYTSEKKYLKSREEEMFAMVEGGASLSNGELFKKLCLSL